MSKNRKLIILSILYIFSILISNYLAGEYTINLFGYTLPGGILVFPLTLLFLNIITYFNVKHARNTIIIGALANVLLLLLGTPLRIIIASISAFLLSQFLDVYLFNILKKKKLWIRNNTATIISQGLDSVVFTVIAFYGVLPILPIIITQYIFKIIYSLADTPFCYLGVRWMKGRRKGPYNINTSKSTNLNVS